MSTTPLTLSPENISTAFAELANRDADLAAILENFGTPPFWSREPGFQTLIHIILEQQVSLASAKAAFEKLRAIANPLTPENFMLLDDHALKLAGFSRQKTRYCRHLAQSIVAGELDLHSLNEMDAGTVRGALLKIKGIGNWTADVYLLMALRHADAWPVGDLALAKAAQEVKSLNRLPDSEELQKIGESWRPWRSVAARLLWHHYLSK